MVPVVAAPVLTASASSVPVLVSVALIGLAMATNALAGVGPEGEAVVFASADRGQTWQQLGQPTPRIAGPHGLALAVPSRTLWAATREGVLQNTIAWPVAARFEHYYGRHDGYRLLGIAISFEIVVNGYISQFFEKGRLEDHESESSDPNGTTSTARTSSRRGGSTTSACPSPRHARSR